MICNHDMMLVHVLYINYKNSQYMDVIVVLFEFHLLTFKLQNYTKAYFYIYKFNVDFMVIDPLKIYKA